MAKNRFKEKAKESCDTHGVFCREEISNQKNIGADEVSEAEQRVSRQQAGREDKLQSRGVRSPDKALACLGKVKTRLLRSKRKPG